MIVYILHEQGYSFAQLMLLCCLFYVISLQFYVERTRTLN